MNCSPTVDGVQGAQSPAILHDACPAELKSLAALYYAVSTALLIEPSSRFSILPNRGAWMENCRRA